MVPSAGLGASEACVDERGPASGSLIFVLIVWTDPPWGELPPVLGSVFCGPLQAAAHERHHEQTCSRTRRWREISAPGLRGPFICFSTKCWKVLPNVPG